MNPVSRRKLLRWGIGAGAAFSGLAVADRLARRYGLIAPDSSTAFGAGEALTYASQRLLTSRSNAREFSRGMISKAPFRNETAPPSDEFKRLQAASFTGWRLNVDGMVDHPLSLSIADIKSLTHRSHITEIACEEGWSYIAEWIGTPLSDVLREAGPHPHARYVVYRSIQPDWWESIDMADEMHPQTTLTWGMNDGDLPIGFGGPLRMRVPRQLGYKSVKYINHLTVTDSMKNFGKGLGSASPEGGYAWYAGI